MAQYRQIQVSAWRQDEWFVELEALDKLLFIYLFSNESASVSGLYKALPLKVMAFETGIDAEHVTKALERFEKAGKVFCQDGWMWVVNLRKINASSSSTVQRRIEKDLDDMPECTLKTRYIEYYEGMDRVLIHPVEQEQEQEQEIEQDDKDSPPKACATAQPPPPTPPKQPKKPPKPKPPPLTDGARAFLELFSAKRFSNAAQRSAILELERQHPANFLPAATWAAEKGVARGQAIAMMRKALPNWGNGSGNKPPPKGKRKSNLDESMDGIQSWLDSKGESVDRAA